MAPDIDRLRELFLSALKVPAEERHAYLREACSGDEQMREGIESLIAAHLELGSIAAAPEPGRTLDFAVESALPGDVLAGRYKLLEEIGEGGMGVVWLAEQTEPIQRRVAVKVIKAGMDSKQVLARFDAERQALALMDHPNIARVLDAGTTEAGRPFFVMELVKGTPITRYCDDKHLSVRERLELFGDVCRAVQHAHQKGIIHRDLKPSNILVAPFDGKPVVKVIDFGVAKATGQRLTDATLFTGFGAVVGTPEYMSPEQAETNNQDIDTRSDIYSLGVLLYELLTGSTPLTKKRVKEAAFLEVLRVIREEEPPKPSTRLSSTEELPSVAAQRHTEPAKLTKLVRGELDWIVMKALEKDRNRRYETANGFAMDVQRYLADEQVLACPPSAGYRLRKLARRNKGGLAVSALVLFFLVLLGSGVGWAWRDRAARAAERAGNMERAVERAELLHQEGKRGEALAALERVQLLAREAEPAPPIAERIESLQQLLDAEGRDQAFVARFESIRRDVMTEVDLEKGTFSSGYLRFRDSLEQYGIAVGVTPPAVAATHILQRPTAIQAVVVAALNECLGHAPRDDSNTREWLTSVLREADSDPWRNKVRPVFMQPATLEALVGDIDVRQQPPSFLLLVADRLPDESPSRLDLARRVQFAYPGDFWANTHLGSELRHMGKYAEAVRYYTAALSLRPDNPGALVNRAQALKKAGELEAAVADHERAITVSPRYGMAYASFGLILLDQKKLPEAMAACRKALEYGAKDAKVYDRCGIILRGLGQPNDAIECFRMATGIDPEYRVAYANLGNTYHFQGMLPEASAAYRKAIELGLRDKGVYHNLGTILSDQPMKLEEAIAFIREAIKLDSKYAEAHSQLGIALARQKKFFEAIAAFKNAIELNPKLAAAHSNLGAVLCDVLKEYDKAIECFHTAIDLEPRNATHHFNLGNALRDQGKLPEAIAAYKKSIELNPRFPRSRENLAVLLLTAPVPEIRDPRLAIEHAQKLAELEQQSSFAWQLLGWAQYRARAYRECIATLEKSCKLQAGGTGDAGQWTVFALAHAKLARQEGLPDKERAHHQTEAKRWFEQADNLIDRSWRVRPAGVTGQAIWDFRVEARELIGKEK